jgi:hypothetical protein
VKSPNANPATGDRGAQQRELHFGRNAAATNNLTRLAAQDAPLRLVVKPTASGKWRASFDGKALCTAAAPLVIAARVLIAKGANPACTIEMWHRDADTWALQGQLGAVAVVRLHGERKAAYPARNGSPVDLCDGRAITLAGAAQ